MADPGRQVFITDMEPSLVIGGHMHLTRIARSIGDGADNIRSVEKRLSNHLGSELIILDFRQENRTLNSRDKSGD